MLTTNKQLLETYDLCEKLYLSDFKRVVEKYPSTSVVEEYKNHVLVIKAKDTSHKLYMADEYYSTRGDENFRCCGKLFLLSNKSDELREIQLHIGMNNTFIMADNDPGLRIPYGFLEDSMYDETRRWNEVKEAERKELIKQYIEVQAARLRDCLAGEEEYGYYEDIVLEDRQVYYECLEDLVDELLSNS